MSADHVPVARMRELVEAGEARPVAPHFAIAPMRYGGRWWHVPREAPAGTGYVRAGPELSAEFDALHARLDRVNTFRTDVLDDVPDLRLP